MLQKFFGDLTKKVQMRNFKLFSKQNHEYHEYGK